MKKRQVLICLWILLSCLSGCMLSTVEDLPEKEKVTEAFRQNRELFFDAVEELQLLWQEEMPHAIQISLENNEVYATVFRFAEDGYHLDKTKSKLESETLRKLLKQTAKEGISMDGDGIDFQCDGVGMVTASAYCGIFYTPTEDITKVRYFPLGSGTLSDEDYICTDWSEPHAVEIERVEAGFFYYREKII